MTIEKDAVNDVERKRERERLMYLDCIVDCPSRLTSSSQRFCIKCCNKRKSEN